MVHRAQEQVRQQGERESRPETEFEKKLKIYDTARAALDKEKNVANYNQAVRALSDVDAARKTTVVSLKKDGFKNLADALGPSVISTERALLEKVISVR